MAVSIETQVSNSLRGLESIVSALESLGSVVREGRADEESYVYLCYFLTALLQERFELHRVFMSQKVMPLVADLASGGVR